jgi:23S rRNA pseudouridine1911/1915/1917 synthase
MTEAEPVDDELFAADHDPDSDELYEHHRIVIDKKQSLLRIDKFLMDRLPHATRNKIQKCDRGPYHSGKQQSNKIQL